MSRHVSVVMQDHLYVKMESERGRESKSSFINFVLEQYFKNEKTESGEGK